MGVSKHGVDESGIGIRDLLGELMFGQRNHG